jgi:type II secretory ATPase GspE/PulE/Tfp pilus assembly ATPase PilB-like protein
MQAATTGHLVLSTLHTTDAAGALVRLLDLGVPPFLVASTVRAVLAQRLVRTVCRSCAGSGCLDCGQSGHRGRTGIYQYLDVSDAIGEALIKGGSAADLRAIAEAEGSRSLADDAERWIRERITTVGEVQRVADF